VAEIDMAMKLVVLAAGYATRLYPLTLDRPKPLLDVAGRPMLEHVLERLRSVSFDPIYVVTNSKFAPRFEEWARGRDGITVVDDGTTSDETKRGAIGDLALVLERERVDDDVVVVAGDNLFSEDLGGFAEYATSRNAPVLAVYDVGDLEEIKKYGAVEVDDDNRVVSFVEKPPDPKTTLAALALYFYPRAALPLVRKYVDEGNNPDQPGRLIEWMHTRTPVYAWRAPGLWLDIGSHETLAEADRIFRELDTNTSHSGA
jgi:glucose-1-phosphate thymidylyltransferase